jgi:hypothetical protein
MKHKQKHLSLRELGAGLGISHVAARKLVLRGMPRHDIEAATEWRERNTRTMTSMQRFQTRSERGKDRWLRPAEDATSSFDDWLERDGKVESVEDAVHFFCFYLAGFEQRLDAMPADIAHALRPDAPDEIETMLIDWREALRIEMRERLTRIAHDLEG